MDYIETILCLVLGICTGQIIYIKWIRPMKKQTFFTKQEMKEMASTKKWNTLLSMPAFEKDLQKITPNEFKELTEKYLSEMETDFKRSLKIDMNANEDGKIDVNYKFKKPKTGGPLINDIKKQVQDQIDRQILDFQYKAMISEWEKRDESGECLKEKMLRVNEMWSVLFEVTKESKNDLAFTVCEDSEKNPAIVFKFNDTFCTFNMIKR